MVHWAWLILAFVIGGNVGLVIMAAIICGRMDDLNAERKKLREALTKILGWREYSDRLPERTAPAVVEFVEEVASQALAENELMEARYEDRECYGIGDGIGTTGPRGNGCDEDTY